MLSAVAEARRVLRSGGILLDIHPTDEPTHLEVWHARYHAQNRSQLEDPANLESIHRAPVGQLDHDETLQDFTAATDVITEAMDERGFRLLRSTTFDYHYFFDSLDELTDYLEDNDEHATASEQLLERALTAMRQAATKPKLVIVQRAVVTVLKKL
jgi:hypothetical protein